MRFVKRFACLLLLLVTTAAFAGERWYVFSIGETPVGYASEIAADGATTTAVVAKLSRLGKSVEMRFATEARESASGELQSLKYEMLLSKQATRVEARVEGDTIRIVSGEQERSIARGAAPLLGPLAVARLSADKLRAKGDAIDYSVFSPELQNVAKIRRVVIAAEEPVSCASVRAMKIEETLEGMPMKRTIWLASDGTVVADSVPGPFGAMSTCRATREAALTASGTLPADLYERTLARSNIRIADASAVDRIVLRIRPRDASVALPDFATDHQRVLSRGSESVVEIRRPEPPSHPTKRETIADEYLLPNAILESGHPEIVKVAGAVTAGESDAYRSALALTKWVAENMRMDAGIVMAPASELVRDRKATCMGYATLLASLARAASIPSRVAMGYVYYGGIWGGHAWTEMWIDGRWLPFDAAVYAPGIASAARLSVGGSSFQDGGGRLNAALGGLFGRVDIETIELEAAGRIVRGGNTPYQIARRHYINPGIGLRVDTRGLLVEKADATWPSTMVVAFREGDSIVELHQKAAYPSTEITPDEGTAVFSTVEGGTLWLWSAKGPHADETLRRFLGRIDKTTHLR